MERRYSLRSGHLDVRLGISADAYNFGIRNTELDSPRFSKAPPLQFPEPLKRGLKIGDHRHAKDRPDVGSTSGTANPITTELIGLSRVG